MGFILKMFESIIDVVSKESARFARQISGRYDAFREVKYATCRDFRDLFGYVDDSFDKLAYRSVGLVGICDDIISGQKYLRKKLCDLKDDFTGLENILTRADFQPHRTRSHTATDSTASGSGNPDLSNSGSSNPDSSHSRAGTWRGSRRPGTGTANDSADPVPADSVYDYEGIHDQKYTPKYDPEFLSWVVDVKNRNYWKDARQLQDKIYSKTGIRIGSIDSIIQDAMRLKVERPIEYGSLYSIHFDSRIASEDMKDDIVRLYVNSDSSLKALSSRLEKTYGMHISASTLSRYARKYLDDNGVHVNDRNAARAYRKKFINGKS